MEAIESLLYLNCALTHTTHAQSGLFAWLKGGVVCGWMTSQPWNLNHKARACSQLLPWEAS